MLSPSAQAKTTSAMTDNESASVPIGLTLAAHGRTFQLERSGFEALLRFSHELVHVLRADFVRSLVGPVQCLIACGDHFDLFVKDAIASADCFESAHEGIEFTDEFVKFHVCPYTCLRRVLKAHACHNRRKVSAR
jgi:hypothetical protein